MTRDTAAPDFPVWRQPDGKPLSCVEKIKVLNENLAEIRQLAQDALEDGLLMGCSEEQLRQVLRQLIDFPRKSLWEGEVDAGTGDGFGLALTLGLVSGGLNSSALVSRAGADADADRGARRARQDHRPCLHLRGTHRPDGHLRGAQDHGPGLRQAPAGGDAGECRLPRGRRGPPGETPRPLFTGWMFASSPALSAMDNPIYDLWVLDCKNAASASGATSP